MGAHDWKRECAARGPCTRRGARISKGDIVRKGDMADTEATGIFRSYREMRDKRAAQGRECIFNGRAVAHRREGVVR